MKRTDVMELSWSLKKVLSSDFLKIRNELEHIFTSMKQQIKDDNLFFDTKLILDELICNGIKHGNSEDIEKKVEVSIEINDDNIMIKVKDEGDGFDYNCEDYDPYSLESNGRGLCLVDGLSDELHIDKNTITSIKYVEND